MNPVQTDTSLLLFVVDFLRNNDKCIAAKRGLSTDLEVLLGRRKQLQETCRNHPVLKRLHGAKIW